MLFGHVNREEQQERQKDYQRIIKKGVNIVSKFKNWKELEKELNFTEEENIEMQIEMEIIRATIPKRLHNKSCSNK